MYPVFRLERDKLIRGRVSGCQGHYILGRAGPSTRPWLSGILGDLPEQQVLEPAVGLVGLGAEEVEFARVGATLGGLEVGFVGDPAP